MPSIENWILNPLDVINRMFESRESDTEWKQKVDEFFARKLQDEKLNSLVPSMNNEALHNLPPNTLMKFRCMIQDSYEPEYFLDTYQLVDKSTGDKKTGSSRYKDVIDRPGYDVIMESKDNETGCRQVVYCVAVPGENQWVKQVYVKPQTELKTTKTNEGNPIIPVNYYEDFAVLLAPNFPKQSEPQHPPPQTAHNDYLSTPKQPPQITPTSYPPPGNEQTSQNVEKHHPIPGEDGPVCIVKVYDETMELKVNETYEFTGVFSVDPIFSTPFDPMDCNGVDEDHMMELKSRSPPSSLVPRLHVVSMKPLKHINPLLPATIPKKISEDFTQSARYLRDDLIEFLKRLTFGDEIVAQSLLFHLLSRVYTRTGTMAVGKLTLNITGIPPNSSYPKLFADVIANLVTKTHYLPMTLDNMNKLKFTPKKDYQKNKLEPGFLQLSGGTHLVIDETQLHPGSLDPMGVKNVQALSSLMTSQKVDYDFQFYATPFYHDVNCVVLSEAKSMLPCDLQVKLTPDTPVATNLEEYFARLPPSDEMLNKLRVYLTLGWMGDYDMEPSVMKQIENDFVASRSSDNEKMSADDLHRLLVVARLQSASLGKSKLELSDWSVVKQFDETRKEKMK
uniref:Mini-chromosome maintenance complex-binding protein n=1 Tax=Ciona savignyi TaxID=51511 RepID=H2YM22_CIOSA